MTDTTDFAALVAQLAEDPEKAMTLDLDDETLLALQKKIDPYARLAGPPRNAEQVRVAALSYTNMTEDYNVRFVTTGAVAFLWRMLAEWKVEPENRRWKPAKAAGDEKPFSLAELDERVKALQFLVDLAKEKEAAFAAACEAVKAKNDSLVISEEEMQQIKAAEAAGAAGAAGAEAGSGPSKIAEMQELFKKTRDAEDEYQGTLYVATLELRNAGLDADLRLNQTEAVVRKGPKGRAAIDGAPDRHRGILPGGQQEVPAALANKIIRDFLANHFEYDPDAHVRKAYDEVVVEAKRTDVAGCFVDPHDPTRIPLPTLLKRAPPASDVPEDAPHLKAILATKSQAQQQRNYNTLCHLLREPELADAAAYIFAGAGAARDGRAERWRQMLLPALTKDAIPTVPPQDTFHRLRFYMEANMEALRAATNSIYHEKDYLDFAIHLMDHFTGTPTEVKEWGERFRDKHQDQVVSDIKLVEFGAWTWLTEIGGNRQIANIFNSQTDILKRILDRHEEDKKLGGLLMRQRVKKAKAANIQQEGPDAPGLAQYKDAFPMAAKPALSTVERKRLERAGGDLTVARDLEYYERYEAIVASLENKAKFGQLKPGEKAELKEAYLELEKAKVMLEVPDRAIQIDVWKTDASGAMVSEPLYSLASDAGGSEDAAVSQSNLAEARLRQAAVNPLDYYPTAESKELAAAAFKEGRSAPPLAPFARDFLEELEAKKQADTWDPTAPPAAPAALAANVDSIIDSVITRETA